jgi:hypothetical protein
LINKCDEHFDTWNGKYFQIAGVVRKIVIFISHKFFQLPYSNFYGYLHLTLRTQDFFVQWTWDEKDCRLFTDGILKPEDVKLETYKFKGKLHPMRASGYQKELIGGGEEADDFEGGDKDWNPYDFV